MAWITGTEPKSNIVKDGLALWYDSRAQKQLVAMGQPANVWKDLSGNKNDGHLINFGEGSGWTHDGLKFDGVDDYVQLPELDLNPDGFTVQKNNQIVVYDGDVQKTIDNGEIKTVGKNLLQQSQSSIIITGADDNSATSVSNTVNSDGFNETLVTTIIDTSNANYRYKFIHTLLSEFPKTNEDYVLSFDYKTNNTTSSISIDVKNSNNTGSIYKTFNCSNTNDKWQRGNVLCNWDITTQTRSLLLINVGATSSINDYIAVRKFKFEKGSIATEWTPAPEDVLTNIDKLDEKILYNYQAPEDVRTVQRYMLYNRALTDEEIVQNYNATGFEMTPKSFTRDDYYNFMDFNHHKGNTEYIANVVLPLLGIHPAYQAINNVNLASLPFASILNRLEANITEIGRALSVAYPHARLTLQNVRMAGTFAAGQPMIIPCRIPLVGDWKNCKSWTDDGIAPDYTDANRWENNMKLVHEWANKQPKILTMKPSGTFAAGQQTFLPRGMI